MKKTVFLLLAVIMLIFPVACGKENANEKDEKYFEYDYNLDDYISIADPLKVEAEFEDDKVCTEEEIDEGVFQVILTYADFETVEDRHAERYDKVTVSCVATIDDEMIDDLSSESIEIIIGLSGNGDVAQLLQNEIIGKVKGEFVKADYTYPENSFYYGEYAGQKVLFTAEIISVAKPDIFECTDEFVQGLEGFDFKTVQDFRDSLKKDILDAKKEAKITAVWNAFYEKAEVKKYPEKEYNMYLDDYMEYYESSATEYNISLEKYLNDYFDGITVDELKAEAKEYAEYMTKNDMIFIQLAKRLGTQISEDEYKEGLQKYYEEESVNYDSIEAFVEYYGEKNLRRNILWDKALLQMVDMAISTKQ